MNPTMYHALRHGRVRDTSHGLAADYAALPIVQLPGMPGWLTGEPLVDQGVETKMPNLPREITLPGVDAVDWACQVDALSASSVRLRIAPAGHEIWSKPLDWLGIFTTDHADASAWQAETGPRSQAILRGEQCTVRLGVTPFRLQVDDPAGRRVLRTGERLRQVAGFPMAPPLLAGAETITLNLELGTDEQILGFGEQFGRLVKNGQLLRLHTDDALGTGTGRAYKPVPLWHSTAGYLMVLNTGAIVTADVGHTRPSVLSITLDDQVLDAVLIVDPDPRVRLTEYTRLTGRAEVPPLWAFGYWMGRCRYHSATEMLGIADQLRAHQVPADVLHVDPDWLVLDRLNTDFIWNTDRFGELDQFCRDLDERGFKLSVWEVPCVDRRSPIHDAAAAAGYFVRTADGELAELDGTPTPEGLPRSLVDFTNPEAAAWWAGLHEPFVRAGVAVFKTDFGEGCPNGVATADRTPPGHTHNLYPLRYNRTVSDALRAQTGRNPLVWGRSAWAGSQRYPGQWGGDAESTVVGMQATLRGGLSYALSAPGLWSHDIGGFYGPELTPGLYVRWTQFGALSPLMRAHGLRPREPWEFGELALEICRDWIRLRYALLPYLWQAAQQCAGEGLPVLRPLALEHPDDPVCVGIDDQYLLGADLLVVPIFDDGLDPVERRCYLPAGQWRDWFTGEVFDGPGYFTRTVGLATIPLLVRVGAVIPVLSVDAGVQSTADLLGRPWRPADAGADQPVEMVGFDGTPLYIGSVKGVR